MALARKRSKYVTYEEFQPVKMQTDALTNDLHKLTLQVGDIAEDLEKGFASLSQRIDDVEGRLSNRIDRLEKKIDDGHAAILSAIMQFAPR